ncbi:MAG TPA: hypothetical protein VEJ84_11250 [Acidimicrobiales bacterium]|nr:hypothetical protein [Acidimicrobiales bacterium]
MERLHGIERAMGARVNGRRQFSLSRLKGAALSAALCATYALGTALPAAATATSGPLGAGPVAGTIFVVNAGDLWAGSYNANTVVEYTKAQLAKSGSPVPAVTIARPATGLNWPWAVGVEP